MELKGSNEDIGVVIGRFQTPYLSPAHIELLEYVTSRHLKVIVFIGISNTNPTTKNPLDFLSRKQMIQEKFPSVIISHIKDRHLDHVWCRDLDTRIRELCPFGSVALYGGRQSFIEHYTGNYKTYELASGIDCSATDIRNKAAVESLTSTDFRAGVVYGVSSKSSISYQTVDIAPIKDGQILLCRKQDESYLRFIGGFVDTADSSLEMAAKRELSEETGYSLEVDKLVYFGSMRVDDWRYRYETDKIMTSLFVCNVLFGTPKASDDIAEVVWVKNKDITDDWLAKNMLPAHIELMNMLKGKLNV